MRWAVRFYFLQFLFGFVRRVPLVLVVGAAFVLVFVPDVNQAFGIRYLLWHEDDGKQLAVGFALGVVIVQSLLAAYLLETQRTPPKERPRVRALGAALTYGIGIPICIAVTGLPMLIAAGSHWLTILVNWPFILGFIVAISLYYVGLKLLPQDVESKSWVTKLGYKIFDGLTQIRLLHVPKAETMDMPLHGMAVVAMLFSVFVYAAVGASPHLLFSPLVGVFALLGMAVAAYGFLEYFLDYVHPAFFMLLIGLIYMGGLSRYGLRFPDLERHYADPVRLDQYRPAGESDLLLPDAIGFCGQQRGPYKEKQKRPLVVVCVSGGGLRAAAWTTAVLQKLEQSFARYVDEHGDFAPVDFPCHVRLIAGASGGMVGASFYVANLPNPPPTPLERFDLFRHYDAITEDCLTPIVHSMTYHDVRSVFSPFGRPHDRGQALEKAWTENLRGALDQSFQRMRDGEMAGWRPSLVFSPMLVEEGRRLLISNLDLRGVASNDGTIIQEERDAQTDPTLPARKLLNRFSYESYEFFRLFPEPQLRSSMRLATAARMSASFPYVSSAPTLPTIPRRRVVDAGYYDNDGVSLAASWLFSGANRDWLRKNVSKILLVQIRDGASEDRRKLKDWLPDETSAITRGLEFLTTPPTALFNARVGSSSFRNDGLLEILSQQLISELQLKPLLEKLTDDEIALLMRAKERDTAIGVVAAMSDDPDKMQQLRSAVARKGRVETDQQKMDKLDDLAWMTETAKFAPADKAKWSQAMQGFNLNAKPEQVVDRVLRRPELQASSFQFTTIDEAELRSSLAIRLKHQHEIDDMIRRVKLTFDREAGNPFFTTMAFEYTGEASLSWFLTSKEKSDILHAADAYAARIKLLQQWWHAPSAQDGETGQ